MAGKTSLSIAILVALALSSCAAPATAEVTIPDPGTRIVDKANVIDVATRQKLTDHLAELEAKTGAQVKVLTIPNADGEDIVSFAQRQYELWKLGQKGKDNGALIILDIGDRKVRIHTGYGLEGALPDSFCGSLSRKVRDEFFKAGRYADGINEMTIAVANKVADDAGVKLDGVPPIRHQADEGLDPMAAFILLLFLLVFVFVIYSSMRRQHHRRVWGTDLTDMWYWGRVLGDVGVSVLSSSGGSSSSGGGFGGGGGSFGGGGSSGGGGGGASW